MSVRAGGAGRQEANPLAEAAARGWQVEMRPAGLLIDTCGHAFDPTLMDRLHASIDQESKWSAAVLADPAEVVLRGELAVIEQDCSQR